MKTRKLTPALCAGFLVSATVSFAAERTIPTPVPSEFADTESSVNVPLADWPDLGRKFTLTLALNATPSNCVQVAFGRDSNGDEDLEPEETDLVVGCDCGEWFVWDEGRARIPAAPQWMEISDDGGPGVSALPTNTAMRVCRLKRPEGNARWTLAKVTRRGREDSAAQIAAEICKPGHVLFLR